MCNMCRYNHSMILAAMLLGSTEFVPWQKANPSDDDRAVDPTPLRLGLAAVLAALGPPVPADSDVAAARAEAMPKVLAAFATMTAQQIADLGRLCDNVDSTLAAVSRLGFEELKRRRDAGDQAAADEIVSSAGMPGFITILIDNGQQGRSDAPDFRH